jgi:hypothetical protein
MRELIRLGLVVALASATAACTSSGGDAGKPTLEARGTALTTVKPTRQDLSNKVSLTGKVTLNPVFGLAAPVAGQVRYTDVRPAQGTPTKPTRVASIWANNKAHPVDVPAGAGFAGRLVEDRATVTAGMPIVSAKHGGYGIVAEIDGAQAYKVSDALTSVQAQIANGPGPFACTVLGTIAALPAGVLPEAPAPQPEKPGKPPAKPTGPPPAPAEPPAGSDRREGGTGSDATGLRLVCAGPPDVKMINGASATLEIVTEKAANVLVLPVEAVAGGQGKGKVDVVRPDGSRETRDVVLGLTDGKVIEIKSGLSGSETIAVPGPNLPAAPPKPGEGAGGEGK